MAFLESDTAAFASMCTQAFVFWLCCRLAIEAIQGWKSWSSSDLHKLQRRLDRIEQAVRDRRNEACNPDDRLLELLEDHGNLWKKQVDDNHKTAIAKLKVESAKALQDSEARLRVRLQSEIDVDRRDTEGLEERVRLLRRQHETAQTEILRLSSSVSAHIENARAAQEAKFEASFERQQDLINSLEDKETQHALALQNQKVHLENGMRKLESTIEKQRPNIEAQLQQQETSIKKSIEDQAIKLAKLGAAVEELEKRGSISEKNSLKHQVGLETLRQAIKEIQNRLDGGEEASKDHLDRISFYEANLAARKEDIRGLNTGLVDLRQRLAVTESQLSKDQQKNSKNNADTAALKDKLSTLEGIYHQHAAEIFKMERSIAALQDSQMSTKSQLSEVKHNMSKSDDNRSDFETSMSDLKQAYEDLEVENAKIKAEISTLQGQQQGAQVELKQQLQTFSKQDEDMVNLKNELAELSADREGHRLQNLEITRMIKNLEKKVIDLKYGFEEASRDLSTQTDVKSKDFYQKVVDIKDDVENQTLKFADDKETIKGLEEKLVNLESTLDSRDSNASSHLAFVKDLESKMNKIEATLSKASEEYQLRMQRLETQLQTQAEHQVQIDTSKMESRNERDEDQEIGRLNEQAGEHGLAVLQAEIDKLKELREDEAAQVAKLIPLISHKNSVADELFEEYKMLKQELAQVKSQGVANYKALEQLAADLATRLREGFDAIEKSFSERLSDFQRDVVDTVSTDAVELMLKSGSEKVSNAQVETMKILTSQLADALESLAQDVDKKLETVKGQFEVEQLEALILKQLMQSKLKDQIKNAVSQSLRAIIDNKFEQLMKTLPVPLNEEKAQQWLKGLQEQALGHLRRVLEAEMQAFRDEVVAQAQG